MSPTNSPFVSPTNDPEVGSALTSWKDIAEYVGKGVRTVQRWERVWGLPVRRTKPGGKGAVLAIPKEIDSWVRSQQCFDGQLGAAELERATLLRLLAALRTDSRKLRSENRELQRQLALEQARMSVSKIA